MRALLVCLSAALFTGCVTVEPWERGKLAERSMDPQNQAMQRLENFPNHTIDVREGTPAVFSAGAGGGCGCN